MEPIRPTFDDLGGGLNEGSNPSGIADNQFVLLENFYPFERRIIRRNGTFRKSYTPLSIPLTGLIHFRLDDGTPQGQMKPLFGTPTGFALFVEMINEQGLLTTIAPYTTAPTERLPPAPLYSLYPWVFVQMNGVAYAMRKDLDTMVRITNAGWGRAGIDGPTAAATIAINASGVMTAGDREVVYTFRNRITGAESDYSPASNVITLNADDSVDVTGIATSSNGQVNQRRLYINAPGTAGIYLYAGDIEDNTTTTANINKRVRELGHLASVSNGSPPNNLEAGDVFLDSYLVATDGYDVFIAEAFKPESWNVLSVFDVFRNDGHRVRAVRTFGDRVIIGKTNKVHYFTKIGSQWNRETLSEVAGCYSHHSMQVAENLLLWYGGDDVYASDGVSGARGIGTVPIKKLLARIPAARKEYVTAVVDPKRHLYVLSCHVDPAYLASPVAEIDDGVWPNPDHDRNNVQIAYNYRTGAWCTLVHASGFAVGASPMFTLRGHGPLFEQALYAVFYDGHYYRLDVGNTDDSTLIRARFRTKAWRLTPQGLLSTVRRVFLKVSSVAASLTLRLYRDEDTVAVHERSDISLTDSYVLSARSRATKGINMFSGEKGAVWQLEGEYEAAPPIEVEQIAFEAIPRAERVKVQ